MSTRAPQRLVSGPTVLWSRRQRRLTPADDLPGHHIDVLSTRNCHFLTSPWVTALAGLKRGARAALDDGAPHLYVTLFERPGTPAPRKAKPTPTPPSPAPPSPTAAAPTSAIDPYTNSTVSRRPL